MPLDFQEFAYFRTAPIPCGVKLTTPRTESERRAKGFRFWERPPQGASRGRSASSRTHRERGEAQESSRRVCNDYRYKKNPTPAEEQTNKNYPGEEQTKPPQNKKKPNRCGNHKGHSRSLTTPIKNPPGAARRQYHATCTPSCRIFRKFGDLLFLRVLKRKEELEWS